jgi:hypothetical protein
MVEMAASETAIPFASSAFRASTTLRQTLRSFVFFPTMIAVPYTMLRDAVFHAPHHG